MMIVGAIASQRVLAVGKSRDISIRLVFLRFFVNPKSRSCFIGRKGCDVIDSHIIRP